MKTLVLLSIFSLGSVHASTQTSEAYLKRFHENWAQAREMLPPEVTEDGLLVDRGLIDYNRIEAMRPSRMEVREQIASRAKTLSPDAEPTAKDLPERLIDGGVVIRDIYTLENRGLQSAELPEMPWSDSYWPMYKGIIANRYNDPSFPDSKTWMNNLQYVRSRPASELVRTGHINQLSPAEKYDLLVGDGSWSLTNYAWNQGQKHFNRVGVVAGWMGICHGWSAAAHMLAPVTSRAVEATSASGRRITFYPGDIRALNSMLWANASPPTNFVGSRCKTGRPNRNANGRILDEGCFDTNPSTWHLIITNQIGIHNRSFVMDTTFDYQVWNFSAASYKITYFNPQTMRPSRSLSQAITPKSKYTVDKFKTFRSPNTKYVVGVTMDVQHVDAVAPRRDVVPTKLKTLRYVYDLELDANHNIIGGEWYTKAHPDFLWSFDANAQALAYGDRRVGAESWKINNPIPSHWTELARRSSARGEPMYSVIKSLVRAGF